jgi:hypothetical protein
MGNDQYMLMEGVLVRRFPLYDTATMKPTGCMRQVMYRAQADEHGTLKFKVVRSYDFTK